MVRTRLSSESPKDEESDSKANKVGLSEKAQWQPTAGVFTAPQPPAHSLPASRPHLPMPFLRLLHRITLPQSILMAASPFLPVLSMLPAFNTSSNMNKLLSSSELWLS